jgi:tRNA-modifying protein YgfZ
MRQGDWLVSTDFLALPGAVDGVGADAGVAAHYGNPLREQRLLAAGTAIVDLSHRAVFTVSGPDRLSWLDSLTSQRLVELAPGDSSETLVLSQTGRIEYALHVLEDGVRTWLLLERDEAPELLAWLTSMRFRAQVEVTDRSHEYATIASMGSPSIPIAAPAGVPLVWHDPWTRLAPGGYQYAASEAHPGSSWHWSEMLVTRADLPPVASGAASGTVPVAGFLAAEALRIAAWRPRLATEVDEKSIPHELDWLRSAVHLKKGCYRGQETVAKVHNLGHPPRRLVMLHLDGSDGVLPARGEDVLLGDSVIGSVTSVGLHYEFGPVALAVIRRGADPSAELLVRVGTSTVSAAQQVIVPPDAGATATVPRLPRLKPR